MPETIPRLADVWRTCNKIRAAVFRVGLNLWDWYLPLDPERNCLISESKFISVLGGSLRDVVGLSEQEVVQLADYFRSQDGRVLYHQLCQIIHGEDVLRPRTTDVSKHILDQHPPPSRPNLQNQLDSRQRHRLCILLATIAARDLPLRPYFQDYELVAKNDGRITFAHFSRILNHAKVILAADDYQLLVRRYRKDAYTLDYVGFLNDIEFMCKVGFKGFGTEYEHPGKVIDTSATVPKLCRPDFKPDSEPPPKQLVDIMMRVQEFVMKNRIRVSEFFRDWDPLNTGRMTVDRFRRAFSMAGLRSGPGLLHADVDCVAIHYSDPRDRTMVCWRTFEDDCDQVFTIKELERYPELKVSAHAPPPALRTLPPPGATSFDELPWSAQDACERTMMRLRHKLRERGIDLRSFIRDYDGTRNGRVLPVQFRAALSRAGLLFGSRALAALDARYVDDLGFHYTRLLDELHVDEEPIPLPPSPLEQLQANLGHKNKALAHETDIVQVLAKIKGQVVRGRIALVGFLNQFDLHGELLVSRPDFYRGISSSGIKLTPLEMDTLMDVFAAPLRRRFVEYRRLISLLDEAQGFVPDTERAPLLVPLPHVPIMHLQHEPLNYEERQLVTSAMERLSNYPDSVSNIMELFQECDSSRCGSVGRGAWERALAVRGLLQHVSAREVDAVAKCFGYEHGKGCDDEINYRAFCSAMDLLFATNKIKGC